jgi:hypothetical protein
MIRLTYICPCEPWHVKYFYFDDVEKTCYYLVVVAEDRRVFMSLNWEKEKNMKIYYVWWLLLLSKIDVNIFLVFRKTTKQR